MYFVLPAKMEDKGPRVSLFLGIQGTRVSLKLDFDAMSDKYSNYRNSRIVKCVCQFLSSRVGTLWFIFVQRIKTLRAETRKLSERDFVKCTINRVLPLSIVKLI